MNQKDSFLVRTVLVAAGVLLLCACGSGGTGGGGGDEELYSVVDTWTVANAAGSDYSAGMSLAADHGLVICGVIASFAADMIYKYDDDGTTWPDLDLTSYFASSLKPDGPTALTFGGQHLYVADSGNSRIVKKSVIPANGDTGSTFRTETGYEAYGIASDSDNLYILWFDGSGSDMLEKQPLSGGGSSSIYLSGSNDGGQAVAVDSSGNIYVADIVDSVVRKYNSSLTYMTSFGSSELSYPFDLTVNQYDEILVINDMTSVAVYDTSGSYKGSFGNFDEASGIAADGDYVWVADYNNNDERIYRLERN